MLGAVANGGTPIALEATQLTSCGARNDGVGLLRLAALEFANALEHKSSALPTDSSDDPLETDEWNGPSAGLSCGLLCHDALYHPCGVSGPLAAASEDAIWLYSAHPLFCCLAAYIAPSAF